MSKQSWKLLRTKADHATPDTDYVGTNAAPAEADMARLSPYTEDRETTGIEVVVLAVDADRAVQARGSATMTLTLIELVDRDNPDPSIGGTEGDAPAITDTAELTGVAPQAKSYMPINGSGRFTVRITAQNSMPGGATDLEVWYREVSR